MLEDSLFESRGPRRSRKPITLIVAAIAHAVVVAVLVLIPLLETQALPLPPVNMPLWAPRPVNLKPIGVFVAKPRTPTRPQTEAVAFTAPSAIPDKIATVSEPPDPDLALLPLAGSGNGHTLSSELSIPWPSQAGQQRRSFRHQCHRFLHHLIQGGTDPARGNRSGGKSDSPGQTRISAAGAADAGSGRGCDGSNHQQGRIGREPAHRVGSSASESGSS